MGAMMTAIFGVLVFLNRQTGSMIEGTFMFMFPIPMIAYAVQYGWKSSMPVFAAMTLMAVLFGNPTSIFSAVMQITVGLVFGGMLYNKADPTKTLFIVMLISAVGEIGSVVVSSFLYGYDLNTDVAEMQDIISQAMAQSGVEMPTDIFTADYLKRLLEIALVITGALRGFIIFEVSLLLLKKLRFPVSRPKSVLYYYPPMWTGVLALLLFMGYNYTYVTPLGDERLQNALQTLGICAFLYLLCFGFLAVMLLARIYISSKPLVGGVLGFLAVMMAPQIALLLGFFYVSTHYHRTFIEKLEMINGNLPMR